MQINRISDQVFYIDAPVNLGLVIRDNQALLIDSGIDESVGRKVKRLIDEQHWQLNGILLTHHHADHTGGAPYLVKATGANVYASYGEKGCIEFPILEPLYLSGGAAPPPALLTKFYLAPGVRVDKIISAGEAIDPWNCRVIDLSGHSMGQVGILTEDGIVFAADAVIGPEYLDKHGIPLNSDLDLTLSSYQRLLDLSARVLLPGHGSITTELDNLIRLNQARVQEIADLVLELVNRHHSWNEILTELAWATRMPITNQGQYALANLSAAAYMIYLQKLGQLQVEFNNGQPIWFRK